MPVDPSQAEIFKGLPHRVEGLYAHVQAHVHAGPWEMLSCSFLTSRRAGAGCPLLDVMGCCIVMHLGISI